MPDPTPGMPPVPPPNAATQPAAGSASSGPTINIGDEFGTAKRNLPPAKMLLIAIAAVLVVVAIASVVKRAKPQGSGSLNNVAAVEIPGQTSTMVALTFTLQNQDKPLYVHDIHGTLKTPAGEFTGEAVSAVDFDRYFQAFPALKNSAQPALAPETKLQPGEITKRSVIVTFPVTLDAFNQRQSLSAVIQPYDQSVPITLTK
ncbi:MAG TPA: hypothetical protein VI386_22290 [Candidatus Sulfotelmatobacter sp.]